MKRANSEEWICLVWESSGKGLTADERTLLSGIGDWRSTQWPYAEHISAQELDALATTLGLGLARRLKAVEGLSNLGWLKEEVKVNIPLRYWISTAGKHRKPTTTQRKAIVRQLGGLPSKRPHARIKEMTDASQEKMSSFLDTLDHAAQQMKQRPGLRAKLERKSRELTKRTGCLPDMYPYLPKPWKGKAGRAAGNKVRATSANELALRAQRIHRDEPMLSFIRIAERLGLNGEKTSLEKRISRYLKR